MTIISPTYLGEHRIPRYEQMKEMLKKELETKENITIDIDFLHSKEVDPYIRDVFIPIFRSCNFSEEYIVFQTKSKERMKKVIYVFKSCIELYSAIERDEEFFRVRLYK